MSHQAQIIRGNIIITLSHQATIRYTTNNWLSHQDIQSDDNLTIRIMLYKPCIVEYAINYGTYWDNNDSANYSINIDKHVYATTFERKTFSKKRVRFDLSKNEWLILYP